MEILINLETVATGIAVIIHFSLPDSEYQTRK